MMIDIFQYSNMYTLRKSIQWLADERHVIEECGPYVTKPGEFHSSLGVNGLTVNEGCLIPDWPKLLHLYSRLKPGKTVLEWIQEYEVNTQGIDIRRFTSFGVIKVTETFTFKSFLIIPRDSCGEFIAGQCSFLRRTNLLDR